MKPNACPVIAIDGPAASGKSSVARGLASRLGYAWVNSGAFYRALTWWLLRQGETSFSEAGAARILEATKLCVEIRDGVASLTLDGMDPGPFLRDAEVNANVSQVSQLAVVRALVSRELRSLATQSGCVIEGRDIGTCVFPDTPLKFYVDASPEERLRRRMAEGQEDKIGERDRMDSQRALAPLVAADDATKIDSTHIAIDEVIEKILATIRSPRDQTPAG